MIDVPAPYLKLPLCVAGRADLPPAARLLWGLLAHLQGHDGAPFPLTDGGLASLAREIGLPRRTAQRALGHLEQAALLGVERRRGAANRYAVAVPPESGAKMAQVPREGSSAKVAQNRRQDGAPTRAKVAQDRRHFGPATSLQVTRTPTGGHGKAPPPGALGDLEGTDPLATLARLAWERSPKPKGQTERDCTEAIRRHLVDERYGLSALRDYLAAGEAPGPFWEFDKAIPRFLERRQRMAYDRRAACFAKVAEGWTAERKNGKARGTVHTRTSSTILVKVTDPETDWPEITSAADFALWDFTPPQNPQEGS